MKRRSVCYVLACLFMAGVSSGQHEQENPAAAEPEPTPVPTAYDVQVSFYTWPLRGVMHGGMEIPSIPRVVMQSVNGAVLLPLQRNAQTEAYRYVGSEAPVLVTPVSMTEDAEGNRQYQVETVAELKFPRGVDQVVVILFPEERNAQGRWRHIIVPATNVMVPDGRIRVLNTTDQRLVLELDGNFKVIEPKGALLLNPELVSTPGGRTRFRLRLHGKDEAERARLLHTAVYRSNEERGNLLIVYEENARVRVLKLENHEPPPTPVPVPVE